MAVVNGPISLEEFIKLYGDTILKEESRNYVAVDEKKNIFLYTRENIGKCISGAKIKSGVFKPFKSMAYISITGRNIMVTDTVTFVELAKLASNVEFSLKTNGDVDIDFTYNGFAVPK